MSWALTSAMKNMEFVRILMEDITAVVRMDFLGMGPHVKVS